MKHSNNPSEATSSSDEVSKVAASCGGCCALLLVNLTLGAWCFDYILYSIFGKDIPWYGDLVAGLFLGELAIPATVVCWIVRLCGVDVPLVQ